MTASMVATVSVIRIRNSYKLAESWGTKTSSLTHSHTEKFKSVKLGDRGGQNLVPLRPIQATTVRLR